MNRNLLLSFCRVGLAARGALVCGIVIAAGPAPADEGAALTAAEGEKLYQDHCASCHGAELEGQPDWQRPGSDGVMPAPPHDETGHTWHHSDELLFDYTKLGGRALLARQGIEFASGMPGFGDQLTDAQIRGILAYIKSTWPERQRQIQAARSRPQSGTSAD